MNSIGTTARLVNVGKQTAESVVEATLAAIADKDPELGSMITVDPTHALVAAKWVDTEGPLAGVVFGVKDNIDVAGLPTTGGTRGFEPRHPTRSHPAVDRLVAAGAVVVGKTNLTELAGGDQGPYGYTRNPYRPEASPGGSSSGSGAAVGAGLLPITLGTDTGGSVRMPAAYCGAVGMVPTRGRMGSGGLLPLSLTYDNIGVITSTAHDLGVLFSVLTGLSESDFEIQGGKIVVGIPQEFYFEDLHPEVAHAMKSAEDALGKVAGVSFRPVKPQWLEYSSSALLARAFTEAHTQYRKDLEQHATDFTSAFIAKTGAGALFGRYHLATADAVARLISDSMSEVFDQVDVILAPSHRDLVPETGLAPNRGADLTERWGADMISPRRPASILGGPALSLPIGLSTRGTPIGFQLLAAPGHDALLISLAAAVESHISPLPDPAQWAEPLPAPYSPPTPAIEDDSGDLPRVHPWMEPYRKVIAKQYLAVVSQLEEAADRLKFSR